MFHKYVKYPNRYILGEALITRFRFLLEQEKAVLVAHYYVDDELQELADATGGCVADSLEMARFWLFS